MRGLLVLCFVAVATAVPQYNYQQPAAAATPQYQAPAPQYQAPAPQYQAPAPQYHAPAPAAPAPQYHAPAAPQYSAPAVVAPQYHAPAAAAPAPQYHAPAAQQYSAPAAAAPQYHAPAAAVPAPHYQAAAPAAASVSKHFYIHAAPEESAEEAQSQQLAAGPSHKHYRVVFIKAPSQSASAAAVSLAQAQNEEKTIIYVLTKKTDAAELQANLETAHQTPSKPEVFFIKYKTPEEAEHAQHQIQAQYDALGGTSQVSDEGVAQVQNFIGALGDAGHGGNGHGAGLGGGAAAGNYNAAASGNYNTAAAAGNYNTAAAGNYGAAGATNAYLPPTF